MTDHDYIPADDDLDETDDDAGKVVHHQERQIAQRPAGAAVVFNPLDADPGHFAQMVQQRQQNYASLREFLLANLVRGKDFNRLHIAKDCQNKYRCTYDEQPWHFSGWQLLSPGADKILGILGLGVRYPGADEYQKSILEGRTISQIMLTCHVIDSHGRVISDGNGAATVAEHKGDLHNALSKAQKRSRLEAVKRLPTVSALFESDEFITADDLAAQERMRNRDQHQRAERDPVEPRTSTRYASGRELDVMPFGQHRDVPFSQIDGKYLLWAAGLSDKPDVAAAARRELDRRKLMEPEPPAADDSREPDSGGADFQDDGPPIDAYFR